MNSDNEIFDLKYSISEFIFPRLVAFKKKVDSKEAVSIPYFEDDLDKGKNLSFNERETIWSEVLSKMIFPFEYNCDPDKYQNLEHVQIEARMKKGMELFSKHFNDLWI